MTSMKSSALMRRHLVLALCLSLAPLAHAGEADDRFKALYTAEWNWRQQQFGGVDDEDHASDPTNNHLPAVDAKTQAARLAYWNDALKRLDAIPPNELSAENRVNLAVYRPQLQDLAAEQALRSYEMPFNSDSQFWSDLGFMMRRRSKPMRFGAADSRQWIDSPFELTMPEP